MFSKKSAMLMTASIVVLLCFTALFAADGTIKGNPWQAVAGLFAFLTTGAGAVIVGKLKLIRDLKEAVSATVQAFTAVQIFAKKAPESIKVVPEYVDMMIKLDICSEEIADILANIKATEKYASMLRFLIRESMYLTSRNTNPAVNTAIKEIREKYIEGSEPMRAFDKALEELQK